MTSAAELSPTPVQTDLLFLERMRPGSTNSAVWEEVPASTPVAAIRQAGMELVRAHDALRLRLIPRSPRMTLGSGRVVEVVECDAPSAAQDAVKVPIDLEAPDGANLRVVIAHRASSALVMLVVPHPFTDGWSGSVLRRDLRAVLERQATPRPTAFTEFIDVIREEQLRPVDEVVAFWTEHLAYAEELPIDRPATSSGAMIDVRIAPVEAITALQKARRVTPFVVVTGLLVRAVQDALDVPHLTFRTTFAARRSSAALRTVGPFVESPTITLDARAPEAEQNLARALLWLLRAPQPTAALSRSLPPAARSVLAKMAVTMLVQDNRGFDLEHAPAEVRRRPVAGAPSDSVAVLGGVVYPLRAELVDRNDGHTYVLLHHTDDNATLARSVANALADQATSLRG